MKPSLPVGPEVVATLDDYLDTRTAGVGRRYPTGPLFVRGLRQEYLPACHAWPQHRFASWVDALY